MDTADFQTLIQGLALGRRDDGSLREAARQLEALAGRLCARDLRKLERINRKSGFRRAEYVVTLADIVAALREAIDPDRQRQKASEMFGTDRPSGEQLEQAREDLVRVACSALDYPRLRQQLIEMYAEIESGEAPPKRQGRK